TLNRMRSWLTPYDLLRIARIEYIEDAYTELMAWALAPATHQSSAHEAAQLYAQYRPVIDAMHAEFQRSVTSFLDAVYGGLKAQLPRLQQKSNARRPVLVAVRNRHRPGIPSATLGHRQHGRDRASWKAQIACCISEGWTAGAV